MANGAESGGDVAVVLLHGVGLNAGFWRATQKNLARRFQVIAPDLYGLPKRAPTLAAYAANAAKFMRAKKIRRAIVVGHSLGAHTALELARAHPKLVAGVVALGAVCNRNAAAKKAVRLRAVMLRQKGKAAIIGATLERWSEDGEASAIKLARRILKAVDERAYQNAYNVFAECDDCEDDVRKITAPVLFAAGEDDANATVSMAKRMAAKAQNGSYYVFAKRRHLFPLTAAEECAKLIADFHGSVRRGEAFNGKVYQSQNDNNENENALRRAFGSFLTGVTVVAAFDKKQNPRGFTANSFSSVSLRPPLLSVCIANGARAYDVFCGSEHFSVNILGEKQRALAAKFASRNRDKFESVKWREKNNAPALAGSIAWFGCKTKRRIPCGDHCILIGEVCGFSESGGAPLGYLRGGYVRPELERRAQAAANNKNGVVGVIVERGDAVYLRENENNALTLPFVRGGGLQNALRKLGMECDFSFLYSVYSRAEGGQAVVYRANWKSGEPSSGAFFALNKLPAARIGDAAVRVLLRRFAREKQSGEHQIYIGDERAGIVHGLRPGA